MEAPDKYDRAYYHQQITGFGQLLNRQAAEAKSQYELISQLRDEIGRLQAERDQDAAKIGELQARMDAMAQWAAKHGKTNGVSK